MTDLSLGLSQRLSALQLFFFLVSNVGLNMVLNIVMCQIKFCKYRNSFPNRSFYRTPLVVACVNSWFRPKITKLVERSCTLKSSFFPYVWLIFEFLVISMKALCPETVVWNNVSCFLFISMIISAHREAWLLNSYHSEHFAYWCFFQLAWCLFTFIFNMVSKGGFLNLLERQKALQLRF